MLKQRDVISVDDIETREMFDIFELASKYEALLKVGKKISELDSKIMATFFYEPSTRTRLSFESAMHRLGGSVLSVPEPKSSSAAKGETLADTMRMASSYSDIIVIRHPLDGSARLASKFSTVPVINGGDGSGQHPTQTLLDLYTIWKEFGDFDKLTITILGDLKYGRTTHSLIRMLSRFKTNVNLVSPDSLRMPEHVISGLPKNFKVNITDNFGSVIGKTDVLYVTRIQKERFVDPNEYQGVIGAYSINNETVAEMKKGAIILHPLPRIDEIAPEVDKMENARYFQQAANGVPVRMALIRKMIKVN
ncbi:MAG: aspartate carbamoyltransferase [Thermoplasmataceae archaeon]